MAKIYAGVGSRLTPMPIQRMMRDIASKLYDEGWTLRTGGARGADDAFMGGAQWNRREIFRADDMLDLIDLNRDVYMKAWNDFQEIHPNPAACKEQDIQHLHMRNGLILLGWEYDEPCKFVICWTPSAQIIGGTGQTIRLANKYNIPVFNLANPEHYDRISRWLGA